MDLPTVVVFCCADAKMIVDRVLGDCRQEQRLPFFFFFFFLKTICLDGSCGTLLQCTHVHLGSTIGGTYTNSIRYHILVETVSLQFRRLG